MIKVSTTGMAVSLKTDLRFPISGQWGHGDRIIHYRRLNKQRSVFPSSQALMKALYLGTFEIAKKWTMPIRNWGKVRGELEIMYPDRTLI